MSSWFGWIVVAILTLWTLCVLIIFFMSICLQCITYDQIPDISLRGGKKRRDAIAKCLVTKVRYTRATFSLNFIRGLIFTRDIRIAFSTSWVYSLQKVSNYTARRLSFRRAQSVCIHPEESYDSDEQDSQRQVDEIKTNDGEPVAVDDERENKKSCEKNNEERKSPLHQLCHGIADSDQEEHTCSICLEPFQEGEEVSWAKYLDLCNHVYHTKCISIWLEKNFDCPCCRANFFYRPHGEHSITSRACRNLQCLCKSSESRIHQQRELEYITCRTDAQFCASQGLLFCVESLSPANQQQQQERLIQRQPPGGTMIEMNNDEEEGQAEIFEEVENITTDDLEEDTNMTSELLPNPSVLMLSDANDDASDENSTKDNGKEFFDCVSYGEDLDIEQGYQSVTTNEV